MGRGVEELGVAKGRRAEGGDVLSLYMLRHGETAFSHHNRFCGRIDAPLTAEGRAMAAAFAERYGNIPWTAFVTSSRTRTIDTAAPLAARVGLEVRRDARLDEMSFGEWQGLSKAEAAVRHPEHYTRWLEDPSIGAPGGELPQDVAERALSALADVRARHARGNVLIVSHKAILRILFCRLMGVGIRQYRNVDWPVSALTRIDIEGRQVSLRVLADRSHLAAGEPETITAPAVSEPAAGLDAAMAMTG